jgi:hypothetical protein
MMNRICKPDGIKGLTATQRMTLTVIASFVCLIVTSLSDIAAQPLIPSENKSFKTVPFDPAPPEAQRLELERVVALCIKTVGEDVPDGHFKASLNGGIVNIVGIDRERFKFWKCMMESGHPLAPINK